MTGYAQLAAAGPSPLWYATRAAGTMALLLLTGAVALGVATAGRYAPVRVARFELGSLHRNLSVLALVFLAVHITTAVADSFVHLGWLVALVPFGASYRPLWLGLGTAAFDLLLAVALTSAVRLRIGRRWWKAVHWTSYAAWPLALFHALGTGSDTRSPLQLTLYAVCLAAVVAAVGWRLHRARPGHLAVRVLAGAGTVALCVLLTAFTAVGPLRHGWAQRAAAPPPCCSTTTHGPTTTHRTGASS